MQSRAQIKWERECKCVTFDKDHLEQTMRTRFYPDAMLHDLQKIWKSSKMFKDKVIQTRISIFAKNENWLIYHFKLFIHLVIRSQTRKLFVTCLRTCPTDMPSLSYLWLLQMRNWQAKKFTSKGIHCFCIYIFTIYIYFFESTIQNTLRTCRHRRLFQFIYCVDDRRAVKFHFDE